MLNTEALINLRSKRKDEIYDKKKEILELEKNIKDINKMLWKSCDHIWVREPNSDQDLIRKRCKKCDLGCLPSLYR